MWLGVHGVSSFRDDGDMRDARPFLAHHLRNRADQMEAELGIAVHWLARWVENLPAGDTRMQRIARTDALAYSDGHMVDGDEAAAVIDEYAASALSARERWLEEYTSAVELFWSKRP
jgi:hypothetical protein